MGNVKISDLPLLTNAPEGSTLVGIHNGTPVRFPKTAVGGGALSENEAISISTVNGLTPYVVNCTATTYMNAIKDKIVSSGGDPTRLNLVSLQGSGRGEMLLISMVQAGSTSYQIKCLELNNLWSYYGFHDLSSTLVSNFLTLSDSSNYDSRLEDLEGNITRKMNSYGYNVTHAGTTLRELIISLKAQGYTSNDPLILKLTGAVSGNFVGYINSWASDYVATLELSQCGTGIYYSAKGVQSSTPIKNIITLDEYKRDLISEVDELDKRITDLEENPGSNESGGSNSIPYTTFQSYSHDYTVDDLIYSLHNVGIHTIDGQPIIVNFVGMIQGTFLCKLSNYYSNYYGCEFTDLTNLKKCYFEGESSSLNLYDNLSNVDSESSGDSTMPTIRVSNWQYTEPATLYIDENGIYHWSGEITFSIYVQDGAIQEGDEIQICGLRKTYGKYKLRRFYDRVIMAEDLDNLSKEPYLQFAVNDMVNIYRTDTNDPGKVKPKFIRIRRPIWGENCHGEYVEVNALFSNAVPVHIGLKYEDITEYE